MNDDVVAAIRVRLRPENLQEVAEHLRRLLCGGSFTFVGHSPVDMNSSSLLPDLALDEALGDKAVEVRLEQRGTLTVGAIVLHYDEEARRRRPALEVLATSSREPDRSTDDPEARIDQRPVVTIFDNLAVVRSESLANEASTAIFIRSSDVDWRVVWRAPSEATNRNDVPGSPLGDGPG